MLNVAGIAINIQFDYQNICKQYVNYLYFHRSSADNKSLTWNALKTNTITSH